MTRTLVLAVAAVAALSATPALALDCEAGFRAFTHLGGETCIPEQPQRIVAARGDSIATPLLDIGAPLVGAGFSSEQGESFLRGASDIFGADFVAASGVQPIGDQNGPDMEAIAALEPDLIILPAWQLDLSEKTAMIAPTIVLNDNLPFLDHLAMLADATGLSGVYDQRLAGYRAKIERIQAQLGDPSAITVSRFDMAEGGLWYYPNWGAVDQVITDIGFSRPAVQSEAESRSDISFEMLPEFDGDILISSYAPRFGQTIPFFVEQWDQLAPFWRNLEGVEAGNHYWYERDVWVGYTFKSLETAADGLLLLTQGRFPAGE
ncbi:ABC transporter substrate-binding protein [Devosia sediminis]|uniref:ABC transporter substrate-binding protein n=1 Tax=Devosia sediminis TaxID=2798801 RepID=A0A934MKD4_9HYPH|nr:ABC transporter substrate-binding protein [Devosia sediminis]MBJ3785028.1 ABC transporter substrate-binding protein [Devosia sediminis]